MQDYPGAAELCDGLQNDCDTVGWTATDEEGTASFEFTDGTWIDVTVPLTGTSTSPATYAVVADGTLAFCPGDWYVSVDASATASFTMTGPYGGASTTLRSTGRMLTATGGGDIAIDGLTFDGARESSASGGAVYLSGGTLTVRDTTFNDNYASEGGAIYGANVTADIADTVFTDNGAEDGGGLYLLNGAAVLDNVTFEDNYGYGVGSRGGAAAFSGGDATVRDSLFQDNTAWYAGALYTTATVDFVDTLVISNAALSYAAVMASTLNCTATPTMVAGFVENESTYEYPAVHASVVVSDGCDWGDGATDNAPFDLWRPPTTYSYGDDATFTCDVTACY